MCFLLRDHDFFIYSNMQGGSIKMYNIAMQKIGNTAFLYLVMYGYNITHSALNKRQNDS